MTRKMAKKYAIRIGIAVAVAVVAFVAVFLALVQFVPFDAGKLQNSLNPTIVYANNGSVLFKISGSGGSDIPYQDIPTDLRNAIVATEDHSFWNSSSVDVRGVLRAAFVDLWSRSLAQGGSTIQEQLAKIVYLNDQKTFGRKIKQVVLGVQIDRHFTKPEILDMYFNRVYLGEDTVGVEEAAQRYFGIDLRTQHKLTLAQAALLAGLPQAPSAYDPLQYPQAARTRRNEVLQNLVKYGYISTAQAAKAERQPLGVSYHSLGANDPWDAQPLLMNFLNDYLQNHMRSGDSVTPGATRAGGVEDRYHDRAQCAGRHQHRVLEHQLQRRFSRAHHGHGGGRGRRCSSTRRPAASWAQRDRASRDSFRTDMTVRSRPVLRGRRSSRSSTTRPPFRPDSGRRRPF